MNEQERQLDLLVAELETENKMLRARNERIEKELAQSRADYCRFQEGVERVLAVSRLALWDGVPRRTQEVGPVALRKYQEQND